MVTGGGMDLLADGSEIVLLTIPVPDSILANNWSTLELSDGLIIASNPSPNRLKSSELLDDELLPLLALAFCRTSIRSREFV